MLSRIWQDIWSGLGGSPPASVLEAIRAAYAEPQRYYHTSQHLQECLLLWDETRTGAADDLLVALALYFHDVVYDPQARDNEARSADWGVRVLAEAGVGRAEQAHLRELIMATQHHEAGRDGSVTWLLDIDLAILGSAPERFQEYEEQIQQEYSWLAPTAYRTGREAVLRGFLQRPVIFLTPGFRERFESPAQRNLAAALDRLLA